MNTAIVLAGGKGKRMGSALPKQFLMIGEKPVIYYTLLAFQESPVIDEIILVTSEDYEDYVKTNVLTEEVMKHLNKIKQVVIGGAERYDSVMSGLKAATMDGYVFIHDGARPCVTKEVIEDCYQAAKQHGSGVAGVPVKDTIKCVDDQGFSTQTLDRSKLWQIQTPQVFEASLVKDCYEQMYASGQFEGITDDAMIVEKFGHRQVKLVNADYRNIKITTPEDMDIAYLFLDKMQKIK